MTALSGPAKSHVKELQQPMKQTRILANLYNIIFGKEAEGIYRAGKFLGLIRYEEFYITLFLEKRQTVFLEQGSF